MKWQQALADYKSYLQIERGLSENSITNYSYDIKKLTTYLEEHSISTTPITIDNELVKQFIYAISKSINPRSQARFNLKGRNYQDSKRSENGAKKTYILWNVWYGNHS